MFSEVRRRAKKAGKAPGAAIYTGEKHDASPEITVTQFDAQHCVEETGKSLEECPLVQSPSAITWVNVEGLHNVEIVKSLTTQFHIHPLTLEDILNVEQRPKIDEFDNYIFITLKSLDWDKKLATFSVTQMSIIFGKDFVLTFQELDTTLFDPIRIKLKKDSNQRLRSQGADYLAYRLIDAIVDQYFVILEALGDEIENVETRIVSDPSPTNAKTIYKLKRQMLMLRKAIWPMREAISHLLYAEDELISKFTRVYLRDVYDHLMQTIDTVETFREMLSSMLDMYLSSLTIRMNEIMKTLTIITTIFIPITAIASIYGMNIPDIPLIHSPWAFTLVFCAMLGVGVLMMVYFRLRKWI